MKNFQIMRYLKKILPIIVVVCVLATYAINFNLKNSNTFENNSNCGVEMDK